MGNYDEDDKAVEVSTERVAIGMIYLVLSGIVFSGLVHLLAQG